MGSVELCEDPAGVDRDGDGVFDACDACPDDPDDQGDQDGDGLGDACDPVCGDEPSALDLDPGARPLRVSKDYEQQDWLALTWDREGFESYDEVVIGTLAALTEGRYDHEGFGACSLPLGEISLPSPPGSSYFLMVGLCGDRVSSAGRDSGGNERPAPIDSCR